MSALSLTALAGTSSSALDATYTLTTSESGQATVRFGDGVHGAALPPGPCSMAQAAYATGGGASGNAAAAALQAPGDRALVRSGLAGVEFGGEGRHFSGVLMQQGRVQIDADFNEATGADWRRDLPLLGQNVRAELGASADEPRLDHQSATGSLHPQVGGEVVVAFEQGQTRSPSVVAPLWRSVDKPPTSVGAEEARQADLQGVSSHLDSMSEMGETESLRLQMAMDRLSKMMSALSNILRKIDTTAAAIVQNIK